MAKMKCFFIGILCSFLVIHNVDAAMSEAQMKAALKMIRNVCQPKSKATDEQIEGMHKGQWDQDKNGQCYLHCIMTMYKLIRKDNTFDWEAGIKALEANAPPRVAKTGSKTMEHCKDAVKTTSDKCIAAYEIGKCIYDFDPENYFLP